MLAFVNLVVIPLITCGIWSRRKVYDMKFDFTSIGLYAVAAAENAILCYILSHLVMRFTGSYPFCDQQIYTVMAFVSSLVIAYITEFVKRFFEIRLEIKAKK
ncbi:MAG: hypothetical protein IKN80_08255 [Clostridiales bacterium]|nr:hypothetical protein [Clostridiales bacterium]